MRSLEIFSLIVLAVVLVKMAIPWSKQPRWLAFLPAFPVFAMLFQVFIEGYRWQMVPAYALSGIVFLAGLPSMLRDQRRSGKSKRVPAFLAVIGSLVGLAVVWITVELCVQVPVFRMPVPSGSFAVGTRTFLLVDESRMDSESPIHNGRRSMSIQAWYPAELSGNEERTSYLRKDISNEMAKLGGPPAFYFGFLDQIRTYAHWNAGIAHAAEQYPVIIYSPSGNTSLHKILFEELASQGYVVVSISHPHWNNVLFDDQGKVIPQDGVDERYQTWFQEENTPAVQQAKGQILGAKTVGGLQQAQIALNIARPVAISELRQWSDDIGFVLDQLAETNLPGSFFDGRIDLSRTGVMGFSLGGANAGQFCATDPRCRAGINVDGFMFGDILDENLRVPFLFLHSENPTIQPGLAGALFFERAENDAYMVQIAGALHGDLGAPMPNGQPIILRLGMNLAQFPDGAYLARIMNDYILAFFDKHLRNQAAPLLDGPSPYPEVFFKKKDGS